METNITRRRLIQGAGAIGVAGIAGNGIVSADESAVFQQDDGQQEQGTAFRVAHAAPDTPSVDVRVNEVLQETDGGVGDDGAQQNDTQDAGAQGNNSTDGAQDGDGGGDQQDDGPLIEGLGFRDVSGYNEVEPGTYQVQVVATEESGLLEGILGGGEDQELVVFDQEVEIEEGTTYTAVAYGELSQTENLPVGQDEAGEGMPTDGDGTGAGNETAGDDPLGQDGNETSPGNETTGDDAPGGDAIGQDDNETSPGNETDSPLGDDGNETGAGEGTDVTEGGEVVVDELSFGEHESFDLEAGDYTLEFRETTGTDGGAVGEDETSPVDGIGGNETVPDGNETAPGGDDTTPVGDDETAGNETDPTGDDTGPTGGDGGVGDGNETSDAGDEVLGDESSDVLQDGSDQGFQVDILEDDLSAPDEEMTRIRVFHAVPDVDAVRIVSIENEGDDGGGLFGGGGGNDTQDNQTGGDEPAGGAQPGNDTGEEPAGEDQDPPAGDDDAAPVGANETAGNETGAGAQAEQQGNRIRQADISPNAGSVYSGFALGYFDPQTAGGQADGGNATGAGDDNVTGGDAGNATGAQDDETPAGDGAGNETTGNETGDGGTPDEDELVQDTQAEQFEFVTARDSEDGERSDGGTGDDGGILPASSSAPATSD